MQNKEKMKDAAWAEPVYLKTATWTDSAQAARVLVGTPKNNGKSHTPLSSYQRGCLYKISPA